MKNVSLGHPETRRHLALVFLANFDDDSIERSDLSRKREALPFVARLLQVQLVKTKLGGGAGSKVVVVCCQHRAGASLKNSDNNSLGLHGFSVPMPR